MKILNRLFKTAIIVIAFLPVMITGLLLSVFTMSIAFVMYILDGKEHDKLVLYPINKACDVVEKLTSDL
jgi:hypothetical protein